MGLRCQMLGTPLEVDQETPLEVNQGAPLEIGQGQVWCIGIRKQAAGGHRWWGDHEIEKALFWVINFCV